MKACPPGVAAMGPGETAGREGGRRVGGGRKEGVREKEGRDIIIFVGIKN